MARKPNSQLGHPAQTGSTDNPFTWVGELGYYQDADGHYFLRRRPLTSKTARFDSEDPTGIDAGDENFYRYVGNNPATFIDPSGLDFWTYEKLTDGRYMVFYVPEYWGIDGDHIFVGYTSKPGAWWSNIPQAEVERPGVCKLSATQFVGETYPRTIAGWNDFFRRKCAELAANQGTAPADLIVDAPRMCTGSMAGATSSTCTAGFSDVPAAITLFLSTVIVNLILEYLPLAGIGVVIQKVAIRCTSKGRVLKIFFKGCEAPEELSEEATEKLLKDLQKKADTGDVEVGDFLKSIDDIRPVKISSSLVKKGMELNPQDVAIFRGGCKFTAKSGEYRIDKATKLLQTTHGVSLDIVPENIQKFGGAFQIKSIPSDLKIIQRGDRLEHFEIVPRVPMTFDRFQELLNQIEVY